jgi:hypothetical protein
MKKQIICLSMLVILACLAWSGCQEMKSATTLSSKNVHLDSTIVKFANVSLEKSFDKSGGTVSVKVSWLFQNIAGHTINASIDVRFFDKKNTSLYNETRWIRNVPAGYVERYKSPMANTVMFTDPRAALVDHVILTVAEL